MNNNANKLSSTEIRSRFLEFFAKRGHTIIPSASLVTSDEKGITNPTLFNTAGMQPLIPYLLGKPFEKDGQTITRLVDSQKCLRTVDIDEIGDKTHATFFEMLGNWSLGDYFKREAIEWSYEFLTSKSEVTGDRGLGLDPNRLYVTVFEGDENAPCDDEAANIWREIFKMNDVAGYDGDTTKGELGRIFFMPVKNNWWEAGENGPCGPDSEMFYDIPNRFAGRLITKAEYLDADDKRDVVEVWNDVFMQYEKKDGKIIGKLPKPSVDTGAGLERLTMTLQGVDNIYDTDLLGSVMGKIKEFSKNWKLESARIVADHIKSAVFLIADGVVPSNTDRGYVLRKLIRRAVRHAGILGLGESGQLQEVANVVIENYKKIYKEVEEKKSLVISEILGEEKKFKETLNQGLKEFEKIISKNVVINSKIGADTINDNGDTVGRAPSGGVAQVVNEGGLPQRGRGVSDVEGGIPPRGMGMVVVGKEGGTPPEWGWGTISGQDAFYLFQTYGFPIELTVELAREKGVKVDTERFNEEFKKHQDLSRSGAEQKFKGGLADANDPMIVRYHTATHLLHQALFDVLGDGVIQKGSNITTERLRFDFAHGAKMTDEEKRKVEEIVNQKIAEKLPMNKVVMSKDEAEKTGAKHFFGEKYGDEISIYFVGKDLASAYSKEFCGGPHVTNTSELAGPEGKWHFKIAKEEAVAQGIRRIKAVLQ
jgi:alanyl-tRNA synthetase